MQSFWIMWHIISLWSVEHALSPVLTAAWETFRATHDWPKCHPEREGLRLGRGGGPLCVISQTASSLMSQTPGVHLRFSAKQSSAGCGEAFPRRERKSIWGSLSFTRFNKKLRANLHYVARRFGQLCRALWMPKFVVVDMLLLFGLFSCPLLYFVSVKCSAS